MKHSYGVPEIAAVAATLLISIIGAQGQLLAGAAKLYAGDHAMTDPLISPVYGDFKGFPPTYLVSGTTMLPLPGLSVTYLIQNKLQRRRVDSGRSLERVAVRQDQVDHQTD
jgi:hypothetical protein